MNAEQWDAHTKLVERQNREIIRLLRVQNVFLASLLETLNPEGAQQTLAACSLELPPAEGAEDL